MSINPIVAGTDGSPRAERAVDKAGELAQALGAPVHVVCAPTAIEGRDWPSRITAQEVVAQAAERLQGRGIDVQMHLPTGEAALSLVAVAEYAQAQMIVVGNKGMTGVRRIFGSLPNRVSHQARCDVLIVPTQSPSLGALAGNPIVVGTDGSSRAGQAVKKASALAKALGSELHIVSSSDTPESALAGAAAEATKEGLNAITHALQEDPVEALQYLAEQVQAAIVVVGSRGMHAGEREWFGNIPDRLSHSATASVLIVFTDDASQGESEAAGAVAAVGSSGEDAGQ